MGDAFFSQKELVGLAWLFHVEKRGKNMESHSLVLDVCSLERKEQKDP